MVPGPAKDQGFSIACRGSTRFPGERAGGTPMSASRFGRHGLPGAWSHEASSTAVAETDEVAEHLPDRPGWTCPTCRTPWPCRSARAHLLTTMTPVALSVYMSMQFGEAIRDLPDAPADALWDRFLGWTHP